MNTGILLVIICGVILIAVWKIGYLEYLAFDKIYGWLRDVTDVAGLSQSRRSFLSLQINANKSQDTDELWAYIGEALEMLHFDQAELHYGTDLVLYWKTERISQNNDILTDYLLPIKTAVDYFDSLLKIEIPLISVAPDIFGKLILLKDVKLGHLQPYTIRRVEHLRRTLIYNLTRLRK